MQLTNLSYLPNRPSLHIQFPNASVLLDAACNFDVVSNFMPVRLVSNQKSQLNHASDPKDPNLAGLKKIGGELLIDAVPEVQPMKLQNIDFTKIDVVLISSWMSLLALPYITEETGFTGVVYATEPTKELGSLALEELVSMMEDVHKKSTDWKNKPFWKTFGKAKLNDPKAWKEIYSREHMEKALNKVSLISFGETKTVNGLVRCTAFSSGHSIGSCNWIIEYDTCKMGYITNSAGRPSHVKPAHWIPFKMIDNLIVTSISRFANSDPKANVQRLAYTMVETLKAGGNVLFPVNPVGNVFDILEVVISAMDNARVSRDVPVYFISPVAASALAFVNIFPEYLVEQKSQRVYNADEPFVFTELIKENRIKVYSSIHGAFSRDFKPPCVVLTGHPSLRFGSAIHFLEMWGNDKKNSMIVTDPDYPLADVYKAFKTFSIPAYEFPIDTRIDFNYFTSSILPELCPKQLIVPDTYLRGRTGLTDVHKNIVTYKHGLPVDVSGDFGRKRALVMPDVLGSMRMENKRFKKDISMSTFNGYLSTYDNEFSLLCDTSKVSSEGLRPIKAKYSGQISADTLISKLKVNGISADHGQSDIGKCTVVIVPSLEAQVLIKNGGTKSIIRCSILENRLQIQKIIADCLEKV
ncbi:unnamed protein product [Bursaphelenchus okinawaensis]|uniref:Beta-Casp domain-containing protein n=1 Tax=Bursaphelenchus okinawaensis TaxID=465554 RepID=A0A811L001_9BILA|nr:unnamed protein product [Bursaphelenchus okinawaensis]CAG9113734.1 unnamed protein product [Bursaphelenchus okinawaensis]